MSTETLVQMRRAVRAVVFRFQEVKRSVEVEWKLLVIFFIAGRHGSWPRPADDMCPEN